VVEFSNRTRYVFSGWYSGDELVSTQPSFTMTVNESTTIVALWGREYEMRIYDDRPSWYGESFSYTTKTDENNASYVSQWYEEGAQFSIELWMGSWYDLGGLVVIRFDKDLADGSTYVRDRIELVSFLREGTEAVKVYPGTDRELSGTVLEPLDVWIYWRTPTMIENFIIAYGALPLMALVPVSLVALTIVVLRVRSRVKPTERPPPEDLVEELSQYQRYLEKLQAMHEQGDISPKAYEKLVGEYTRRVEDIYSEARSRGIDVQSIVAKAKERLKQPVT